jgi:Tol biopolymer transport system component
LAPATGWAHDGTALYTQKAAGGWNIFRVSAESGQAVRITSNGGAGARETPDGRHLYYGKRLDMGTATSSAPNALWRLPIDRGEAAAEEIAPSLLSIHTFGVTDKGVYYIARRTENRYPLRFYDAATRKDSVVWSLDNLPAACCSISPDGRYLLFSQVDVAGSDLRLIDNFR